MTTYRQRGGAVVDHVFGACHQAVAAAGNPAKAKVNPYTLPACSTAVVVGEIGTARVAASALLEEVRSSRWSAIPARLKTDTVRDVSRLVDAFAAWQQCARKVNTTVFFSSSFCVQQLRGVDEVRTALVAVAKRWPTPTSS
jgi:hypothetical protein